MLHQYFNDIVLDFMDKRTPTTHSPPSRRTKISHQPRFASADGSGRTTSPRNADATELSGANIRPSPPVEPSHMMHIPAPIAQSRNARYNCWLKLSHPTGELIAAHPPM